MQQCYAHTAHGSHREGEHGLGTRLLHDLCELGEERLDVDDKQHEAERERKEAQDEERALGRVEADDCGELLVGDAVGRENFDECASTEGKQQCGLCKDGEEVVLGAVAGESGGCCNEAKDRNAWVPLKMARQ